MKWVASIILCIAATALQADQPKKSADLIRIMAVKPTPEPETTSLYISRPLDGAIINKNPVWIQVRVEGFALATNSYFDRAYEIVNSDQGQTIHIIIDDRPYFAINKPALDPLTEQGNYYIVSYKFEVPYRLSPGLHTIRAFPARSYGESLKGENTFVTATFYLENETNNLNVDLSQPYLTYNEPSDQNGYNEKQPVLLDFYLSNCELSPDGYKVRLTIDGTTTRVITSWQPYYIYGLKKANARSVWN